MKITEDIEQIDGIRGANTYLIKTKTGLILIDSGFSGSALTILAQIKKTKKPLEMIVLTHADIDHVGGAAEIKRQTGAKIAISKEDSLVLSGDEPGKQVPGMLGLVFKILSRFIKIEKTKSDLILAENDKIGEFRVIEVPGHTNGSIALYRESDGVIFSGDALLGDRDGHQKDPVKRICADFSLAQKSAEKIKALNYNILLAGHGKPVRASHSKD